MKNKVLNCMPSNKNGTDWELPTVEVNELPIEFSRKTFTPPVTNQGSVGSCVGQTLKVTFNDTDQCRNDDLSAMWIYKRAKFHDYWEGEDYSGTSISGACEALRKDGACLEEFYPYKGTTENYEPLEGADADAKGRKILSYYMLGHDRIDEIKELIMNESLAVSLQIHSQFYDASTDGIVKAEDYLKTPYQGGHAMALTGWKEIDGELHWEFQNSWGVRWGDSGFCYIPQTLVEEIATSAVYYLVTDGEVNKDLYNKRTKKEPVWKRFLKNIASIPKEFWTFIKRIVGLDD